MQDWLRGHLKALLLDTLNRKNVEESGLISWPHLESVLNLHMQRKANYGYHLWGMLMLFLWIKQWNIQSPQDSQALENFFYLRKRDPWKASKIRFWASCRQL